MKLEDALDELRRWTYGSRPDPSAKPWTPNHEARRVKLYRDGMFVTEVPYQCPKGMFDGWSVVESVSLDACSYLDAKDLSDFLFNFGYCDSREGVRKGIEAYEACRSTAHDLARADIAPRRLARVVEAVDGASAWDDARKAVAERGDA